MTHREHNIAMSAEFSPCRAYRYVLDRNWNVSKPVLLAIMLNPSTADETQDDPTIRRLHGFAVTAGFGGMRIMNLFAWRATDPDELWVVSDPVGPENDARLEANLFAWRNSGRIVLAAWGVHPQKRGRTFRVQHMVDDVNWVCLGRTKDGHPRHPLYVPASQRMEPFK